MITVRSTRYLKCMYTTAEAQQFLTLIESAQVDLGLSTQLQTTEVRSSRVRPAAVRDFPSHNLTFESRQHYLRCFISKPYFMVFDPISTTFQLHVLETDSSVSLLHDSCLESTEHHLLIATWVHLQMLDELLLLVLTSPE